MAAPRRRRRRVEISVYIDARFFESRPSYATTTTTVVVVVRNVRACVRVTDPTSRRPCCVLRVIEYKKIRTGCVVVPAGKRG